MGIPLLAGVGLTYCCVAFDYWQAGRPGMALAFVAYALANVGFIIDASKP